MHVDVPQLEPTLRSATERLLAARGAHGHWEGELASSPLSTATAIFALHLIGQAGGASSADHIARGLAWLAKAQNADGGWGDTLVSFSNISTTALVWAALTALEGDGSKREARLAAEAWLMRAAGSLAPQTLSRAITARYGKDRTFSVPILSTLALAGCLGPERDAWRWIPQLPFELGACPHRWFQWLRLPVVSYALPALIALGRLRHCHRPSKNPISRGLRNACDARVLRVLHQSQPASGGFLEATPLTSFVVMSLAASGQAAHPVTTRGAEFLIRSQRDDGSWPIDTNLATWVTTLSVNALASLDARGVELLDETERNNIVRWLLDQQGQTEHPYTHAAPGGWAWTNLSGGVPDADDTPGALLALHALVAEDQEVVRAAERGVVWLLDLQNRDGGIPTFCRGWGNLPFDRSSADLTAHTMRALSAWMPALSPALRARSKQSLAKMHRYLLRTQQPDGAWSPLWFGNQHVAEECNFTYGTSRVIRGGLTSLGPPDEAAWQAALSQGCGWLLRAQNEDGGWGGALGTPSSIEETALAIDALAGLLPEKQGTTDAIAARAAAVLDRVGEREVFAAISRGGRWLCRATGDGRSFEPSPIGFYFAKLWYFEVLYPLTFTVAALGRLRSALGESVAKAHSPLPVTAPND